MIYEIKAIPTTYAGVNFRSRLEARWAALFDLVGLKWEYEPFDLDGWAPDFLLHTKAGHVLAEVKPVDFDRHADNCEHYDKAFKYWSKYQVILLGRTPFTLVGQIGFILDPPEHSSVDWVDVQDACTFPDTEENWRVAGNLVQWTPDRNTYRKIAA